MRIDGGGCGLRVVHPSTCGYELGEVQATVQGRNMRRGRIELTHELRRFQSRAIFSPGGLLCWTAAQPPSKSRGLGSLLPLSYDQDTSP